ncbi:hypothetical protein [Tahibacter caeni]|uniref:hypothetical protein n=1 Tax=Tahibacter caeni TaxID=1453545 RepID=UPI0021481DF1|nr:hypothetical protein [Tahibacter caeni]
MSMRWIPAALFLLAPPLAAQNAPHRAFVTSVQGNGNLASWADSGGRAGLAGADAVCRARARAANLVNADAFVAWLSDTSDDAYCRAHGLRGKRSANCGLTQLPTDAGPWQRTDDRLIAASLADQLAGRLFHPINRDEFGRPLPFTGYVQTIADGTDAAGANAAGADCNGWSTSAGAAMSVGGADSTSGGWSAGGGVGCNITARLYCLEPGSGNAAAARPREFGKREAFVTDGGGPGNFAEWPEMQGQSGIAAADAICRLRAASAGLHRPDRFKALLSDGATPAFARVTEPGLPWVRRDGVRLADDLAALQAGATWTPLNVTEAGRYTTNIGVWTGIGADGGAAAEQCSGWSDAAARGGTLTANIAGPLWLRTSYAYACSTRYALYCLSDADTLFHAGFEAPR